MLIYPRLGADHLPRDAIETNAQEVGQTAYGKGIVDEAMQWNRDRESSSVDSSSDSGQLSTADSSGKSSRGLDPSTLYFKKEDVIMLVDGELHIHASSIPVFNADFQTRSTLGGI